MNFKQVSGYGTLEEALQCAKLLEEEGIECVLKHREKGLFGDPATCGLTWIEVQERDFDRAKLLLSPPLEDADLHLELQCPKCKSLKVVFDISSHKKGLGKIFTWPWDREQFFCEACQHVWDRVPED